MATPDPERGEARGEGGDGGLDNDHASSKEVPGSTDDKNHPVEEKYSSFTELQKWGIITLSAVGSITSCV